MAPPARLGADEWDDRNRLTSVPDNVPEPDWFQARVESVGVHAQLAIVEYVPIEIGAPIFLTAVDGIGSVGKCHNS